MFPNLIYPKHDCIFPAYKRAQGESLSLNDILNAEAKKAYGIVRENINKLIMPTSLEGTTLQMISCKFCGAINKPEDTNFVNYGTPLG